MKLQHGIERMSNTQADAEKVVQFRATVLRGAAALAVACVMAFAGGCERMFKNTFLDRSDVVQRPVQGNDHLLVPTIRSIDPIDEPSTDYSGAVDVKAEDLKPVPYDARISRNDALQVTIADAGGGNVSEKVSRVSESGMIGVAFLEQPVKVIGLNENEAAQVIIEKLRQGGLYNNPQVTVTIAQSLQRTFTLLGSPIKSGQYPIPDSDYRLLAVLAIVGDLTPAPDYIYIVRKVASEKAVGAPAPTTTPAVVDPFAPKASAAPQARVVLAQASTGDAPDTSGIYGLGGRTITIDGKTRTIGGSGELLPAPDATQPSSGGTPGVAAETAPATLPSRVALPEPAPLAPDNDTMGAAGRTAAPTTSGGDTQRVGAEGFDWSLPRVDSETRLIRVPYAMLRGLDMRFNVVVRPGDIVVLPITVSGSYYMGGHVNRTGVYGLSGQDINLKQAIIAAGMTDATAVPENAYLIRRVKRNGQDEELFVKVDLLAIFEGRQSDVYLKPNDSVLVGTDVFAALLAVIRSSFRFSYGFGFTYDRNFYNQNNNNNGF